MLPVTVKCRIGINNEDKYEYLENFVNKIINQQCVVQTEIQDHQTAVNNGAIALFGEKYEDEVRVVSMGNQNIKSFFSMEINH